MSEFKLLFERADTNTLTNKQGYKIERVMDYPEDRPARVMFKVWHKSRKVALESSGGAARTACQNDFDRRQAMTSA